MVKIVYPIKFLEASNEYLQIAEGLCYHPDIEAHITEPVSVLGKDPGNYTLVGDDLVGAMKESDFVITYTPRHANWPNIYALIEEANAWDKTVIWDLVDGEVDLDIKSKCLLYFKREFQPQRDTGKALPLDLGILHGIKNIVDANDGIEKDIDFGFFYSPGWMHAMAPSYARRIKLFNQLLQGSWGDYLVVLGRDFPRWAGRPENQEGSRQLYRHPDTHEDWIHYLAQLLRCKTVMQVFASYSQSARLWEFLYSGALCLMDTSTMPHEHPYLDGEHCFIYDASDTDSVDRAIKKIKEYLEPGMEEERARIAKNAKALVANHHTSLARMEYMLKHMLETKSER